MDEFIYHFVKTLHYWVVGFVFLAFLGWLFS